MTARNLAAGLADAGARLLRVRSFVRSPIWLYRHGLGFVFGSRLLLLEHTGRASGLARHVVLEVVDHPTPTRYVVVSGFGTRAQWFRNIMADPRVHVQVSGRAPVPATASRLDDAQASQALRRYQQRHPRAWARLRPVLERTLGASISTDVTDLPLVALDID